MSRYSQEPTDLTGLKTVSLHGRGGKVHTGLFARPHAAGTGVGGWLDSLPRLLAADSLRAVADAIWNARQAGKPVMWGLGGHVIKCGLAPLLLDLASRGMATSFSMNGAAAIHDLEIALAGYTSEDVEAVLPDGSFGSAEETGREFNQALIEAARDGIGAGEGLARKASELANPEFAPFSLLCGAHAAAIPVTVHIAVGTDTPHTHPHVDAAAMGTATHHDFRLICTLVRGLDGGGVYVNLGSAVVMPEVFLKALSTVRNLGHGVRHFTTANFDFLQHYRPKVNVVDRPHAQAGGKGYAITGHHEILLPLLAALLVEREAAGR
ncbi:MAG: hypothetical protein IPJ98_13010 [Bryobacterales bacterium]|nr:hypothetical protein [Bryobacterales bacterium]